MKVVATRHGFFNGKRVRAGTEFEVPAGSKAKWFVPADKYVAPPPKQAEMDEIALSQINRAAPKSFVEAMKKPADPNADADPLGLK